MIYDKRNKKDSPYFSGLLHLHRDVLGRHSTLLLILSQAVCGLCRGSATMLLHIP